MKLRPRPAFTLFQLLVVLALLLILLGLLLPAVAKVRQAAARSQSQNNMKQLGLACHNYHDVNGHFCPGNDANNFSASAYLLPYIEQNNLYKLIDFKKPVTDKDNAAARAAIIKTFLSPNDPQPNVTADTGATNYLFCAGSKHALKDNDGVFYQDSKTKFQDITDGTSNTIMAGETLKGDGGTKAVDVRRQHVQYDKTALTKLTDDSGVQDFKDDKHIVGDRGASWLDGRFLQGTFTATRVANDPKPDVNCEGLGGLSGLRSLDKGGINLSICDGSVRHVSKKIDRDVWKALATRAGGEVVNFNDF
jgi:type II secretory pathway pseudopilin PulG